MDNTAMIVYNLGWSLSFLNSIHSRFYLLFVRSRKFLCLFFLQVGRSGEWSRSRRAPFFYSISRYASFLNILISSAQVLVPMSNFLILSFSFSCIFCILFWPSLHFHCRLARDLLLIITPTESIIGSLNISARKLMYYFSIFSRQILRIWAEISHNLGKNITRMVSIPDSNIVPLWNLVKPAFIVHINSQHYCLPSLYSHAPFIPAYMFSCFTIPKSLNLPDFSKIQHSKACHSSNTFLGTNFFLSSALLST